MKKEIRQELRDIKRQGRAASLEFNAAIRVIRKERRQLARDEKTVRRILFKRINRLERRRSILEGRLS